MEQKRPHISGLSKNTYTLILAGGKGSRLYELTEKRSKPSLYFGGKHRIIDFPLSNCVNSGLRRIGVATQYRSHSLITHLQRSWGHFRRELGEYVEVLPASQQLDESWYNGTADAVYQNIDIIMYSNPKWVLVLSGDHVYRMDYCDLIAEHVSSGAEMTVACIEVPIEEAAGAFGVLTVDENNKVLKFTEKPAEPDEIPGKPGRCLASMGNYVFNSDFLLEQLEIDAKQGTSSHDFGNDIIPRLIEKYNIFAFPFRDPYNSPNPYWRDVGTLDAFWEANMDLVSTIPKLDLYDQKWPIWTYQEQLAPAKFVFNNPERRGMAVDSTVSSGCIVSGSYLEHSLLSSSVVVNSYSRVTNSVILPNVTIERHCKINNAIIDRGVIIPEGTIIGLDEEQDTRNGFRRSEKGIVLVTQKMIDQVQQTSKKVP